MKRETTLDHLGWLMKQTFAEFSVFIVHHHFDDASVIVTQASDTMRVSEVFADEERGQEEARLSRTLNWENPTNAFYPAGEEHTKPVY